MKREKKVKSKRSNVNIVSSKKSNMIKKHNIFMQKFLMVVGLVMLYFTIVYIVPNALNHPFDIGTIIAFSIAYIPFSCWYYNTFKNKLDN